MAGLPIFDPTAIFYRSQAAAGGLRLVDCYTCSA